MAQGRYWLLTIPHDKWEPPVTQPENIQCLMGQQEIGITGYKHWQLLAAFKTKVRLAAVKKLFGKEAHCELSRSEAAKDYVHKEETAVPGTRFKMGDYALKRNDKDDWNKIKNMAKTGGVEKILDEFPEVGIRYYNTFKNIAKDYMKKPDDLDNVCGVWIWGPPGVGKSRKARQDFPDAYFKMCNKWWDGYQQENHVIIDDFDTNHKVLGHHLKIWADRYSFVAEAKGGALHIRPKNIVVTSNYSIDEIFAGDLALVEALKRRFKIIHCPLKLFGQKRNGSNSDVVDLVSPSSEYPTRDAVSSEEGNELPRWDELGFLPTGLLAPETELESFDDMLKKFQ